MKKIIIFLSMLLISNSLSAALIEELTVLSKNLNQLQELLAPGLVPLRPLIPPALSSVELGRLETAQKNHSDELMIEALTTLGNTEFHTDSSMQSFVTTKLKELRANVLFFQREALDQLLDEREGLVAQLQKLCSPAPRQDLNVFLLHAYGELDKHVGSVYYTSLRDILKTCFFNASELNTEPMIAALLQLATSVIVSQRKLPRTISATQENKSDTAFMTVFTNYQEAIRTRRVTELVGLGYELNRLRVHPDFLKFHNYMLYPTNRTELKRGEHIVPLILFVRNVSEFLVTRTSFAASYQLSIQTRRFLFNEALWKTSINDNLWKPAFDYEFKKAHPVGPKTPLVVFVKQELPKINSLTLLGRLFKQLEDNYKTELGTTKTQRLEELRDKILFRRPIKKEDAQEIINFLVGIISESMPEGFVDFLDTLQLDAVLITTIHDALNESEEKKEDLGKLLLTQAAFYNSIQKELISLYRTPLTVFLAVQSEFKNKEMRYLLDPQRFYFNIKPCGMLIRVFEYFIREVDTKAPAKTSWEALKKSLECLNNPDIFLAKDGRYTKIYDATLKALSSTETEKTETIKRIEQGKPAALQLAPVLCNLYIEGNTVRSFDFLPSLRVTIYKEDEEKEVRWGIYDHKLTQLLNKLNNKNVAQTIQKVRKFVESTKVIPTDKEQFTSFIGKLQEALQKTIEGLG